MEIHEDGAHRATPACQAQQNFSQALSRHQGMSLIELLIGMIIVGILLMLGLPSYRDWIGNQKIRVAAEAIENGMQLARNEAVRRNTNVQLVLGNQSSWTVSVVNTGEQIQARSSSEGSDTASVAVTPAGASTITFNALGRVTINADGSPSITQVDVDSLVLPAANSRELRVTTGVGGNIKLCDPQVAAGDPRACV